MFYTEFKPVADRLTLFFLCLINICLVVYEHRSRLEKSLQKERLEHKKAKEGERTNTYTLEIYLHLKELWDIHISH